jgi:hypothetical protein
MSPRPISADEQEKMERYLDVLEQDRQFMLRIAEDAGGSAYRLGYPRTWSPYPDNGLHVEQREAWLRGYDAERAAA